LLDAVQLQFLPAAQRIWKFAATDVSKETFSKLKLPVVLSYKGIQGERLGG